jgi:hypothetical protein
MGQKVSPVSLRLSKSKDWEFDCISLKKEYPLNLLLNLEFQEYIKKLLKIKSFRFFNIFLKKYCNNIYIYIYYYNDLFYKRKKFLKKKKYINIKNFLKSFNIKFFSSKKRYKNFINILRKKKKIRFIKYKLIKEKILKFIKIKLLYSYLNKVFKKIYKFNFLIKFIFFNSNLLKFKKMLLNYENFRNRMEKECDIYYRIFKILNFLHFSILNKNSYLICEIIKNFLIRRKRHKKFFFFIKKDLDYLLGFYNEYFIGFKIQLKGKINGKMRKKKVVSNEGIISLSKINQTISYYMLPMKTKYGIFSIKVWLFFI